MWKRFGLVQGPPEALQTLLELAEHGDVDALMMFGLALLMEDKPWYDAESGRAALEKAAESDSPVAQYYLGKFLLEGEHGISSDPITAKPLLEASANRGYPPAIEIFSLRLSFGLRVLR